MIVATGKTQLFDDEDDEDDGGDTARLSSRLNPPGGRATPAFAEELGAVDGVQAKSTQHLVKALEPWGVLGRVIKRIDGLRRRVSNWSGGYWLGGSPNGGDCAEARTGQGADATRKRAVPFSRDPKAGTPAPAPGPQVVGEPSGSRHVPIRRRGWTETVLVVVGLLAAVILVLFRSIRWVLVPWRSWSWRSWGPRHAGAERDAVEHGQFDAQFAGHHHRDRHLHSRDRPLSEQRQDHDPVVALGRTMSRLAPAIFWTGATTAVGFAALLSSNISPVRSFGIMMSLATLLVLLGALLLLPGGILLGRRLVDPGRVPGEGQLVRGLESLARGIRRHPFGVMAAVGLVVLVAGSGLFRLRVETDFSENFREDSPIRRGLEFVETKLGGAGNWEVNFPVPGDLDQEGIDRVEKLAERLRDSVPENDRRRSPTAHQGCATQRRAENGPQGSAAAQHAHQTAPGTRPVTTRVRHQSLQRRGWPDASRVAGVGT
ncbi:MAG: hypothetical protein Ct9H300mP1_00470 [Planctomycetaceae bacterium]|nr:MAG: hypothetical protein Ct9H300mP1_00470 [Planctomycetaceae bacterium]